MNIRSIFYLVFLAFPLSIFSQSPKMLEVDVEYPDFEISEKEEASFRFTLKKDVYYSILVSQKGIDVELYLKNKEGKEVAYMDSPNGKFGPEKIVYSPDTSAEFSLLIKPFVEEVNSKAGKYAVSIKEIPKRLKTLSYEELIEDFELLKNAHIETKVGLWYNSYAQFDSICTAQKNKIKDQMTDLEFYQLMSPIITFTKEGHSNIRTSEQSSIYIRQMGKYFPFRIKILEGKVYVVNNLDAYKTQGLLLKKINGHSIEEIMETFLLNEPADGYNITSKYDWIEGKFATYYLEFFEISPSSFDIELLHPKTNEKVSYQGIPSYSYKEAVKLFQEMSKTLPKRGFSTGSTFQLDAAKRTAILTVNSFSSNNYEGGRDGFKKYLKETFSQIREEKIQHLVIDLRLNEGGEQGMEDHLLSYLIDAPYEKYEYVEIPGFSYTFLEHTDYQNQAEVLQDELDDDFYLHTDGRYLDIEGHYHGDAPQKDHFQGKIYILINGLTFSGGSEFSALAKNYTNALFVGEETGGGYYGNSSGYFLQFTLPNSQLTGRIPLCKFVVATKEVDIPFGRGVMPDHYVQPSIEEYLNEFDTELEFVLDLIEKG